ncbi:hypothetical protein [Synechococcus sp. MU1617]|uniref:hypothetical protein n=1 Tax=Synechococcus sp. MU1617 TaxID=2508346 RepID=UPI001CF846CA|nr:hypothetical protein [Synechococcus sp. MU1617]
MVIRLMLALALLASWASPARAISLSARTDRLIDRLQQLGVVIDRLERCGPGAERAAYNMGVNRLCLSQGLRDEPGLQLDVLTHEAIHVVQDCLDGLETPSSSTISLMLQAQGGFSPAQVDRFLAHHLDHSTAGHVLTVTQALGPLQRQREVEAYALQSQTGMVESLLARHC